MSFNLTPIVLGYWLTITTVIITTGSRKLKHTLLIIPPAFHYHQPLVISPIHTKQSNVSSKLLSKRLLLKSPKAARKLCQWVLTLFLSLRCPQFIFDVIFCPSKCHHIPLWGLNEISCEGDRLQKWNEAVVKECLTANKKPATYLSPKIRWLLVS